MICTDDLFDLNGDGELDGVEMAFAHSVIFGSKEAQDLESLDLGSNADKDNMWEE